MVEVLGVAVSDVELVVEVQTAATVVGCSGCGTRARPKDRRWVSLRDAPVGDRAVLVRWRKRIWSCPEPLCAVKTWTEQSELAEPRRVLTARAETWATNRVAALEGTPASIARDFGVAWSTVWAAVTRAGTVWVEDPDRVGPTAMVGFDETVMQPAHRRRRRRFVTAVVDVGTGQILDIFEGRDARELRAWMAGMDPTWLAQIQVVSVDPHEGYRSAVTNPDPVTGRPSPLAGVTVVVDPFHIVRLANAAVTRARQRVQQATLEHRGWKGDPLYDIRKLLLLGAEPSPARTAGPPSARGSCSPPLRPRHHRQDDGPRRFEPHGPRPSAASSRLSLHPRTHPLADTGASPTPGPVNRQELLREVYATRSLPAARRRLERFYTHCASLEVPELRRLARTIRRWEHEILAAAGKDPVLTRRTRLASVQTPWLRDAPLRDQRHRHVLEEQQVALMSPAAVEAARSPATCLLVNGHHCTR
jgi:transposase